MDTNSIEIVLTSYGPVATVWVGKYLKKKRPDVKWVLDMRDPMDSEGAIPLLKRFFSGLQKRAVNQADIITAVSYALRKKLSNLRKEKDNMVFTIENGYGEESVYEYPVKDKILRIGYTGMLYDGKRKMDALFRCIAVIEEQEECDKLNLEIHYAGTDFHELERQAKEYGTEQYLVNHGFLSREQSLKLQQQCDILCALSWNTEKEQACGCKYIETETGLQREV